MRTTFTVVDDFFENPKALRAEILKSSEFKGEISPFDSLFYPNISLTFPSGMLSEWKTKTEEVLGYDIKQSFSILRMSKQGYTPYQFVHHDANILPYASILYLNEFFPPNAGTALMRSKVFHVEHEQKEQIPDVNDEHAWEVSALAAMKFNRILYFPSKLFHQARPLNGFGKTHENARLIMASWFSLK